MYRSKLCKIALHAVFGEETIKMPLLRQPQTACFCPGSRFLPPFYTSYNTEAVRFHN